MVSVQQAISNHAAEALSSASTAGRWTMVLWDRWRSKDKSDTKETFTIITTAPSAFAQWHDRMPLILEPDEWETWLQGDPDAAAALMRQANEDVLVSRPVNKAVGNVKNNGPKLLEAAQ